MNHQTGCCFQEKWCCSGDHEKQVEDWIAGFQETDVGKVPLVATQLTFKDHLGNWKARWGINRMNYTIKPGLYGVGNPDSHAPVLVTANYKMTFDKLRKELDNLNCWLLVLDTKGINVWCAAGKGTFGTEELIVKIMDVHLNQIISHKNIILPQLGAPGVAGHAVKKSTGFKVIYGPVRAEDIQAFLKNGCTATKPMREVTFTIRERSALIPMEILPAIKWVPILLLLFSLVYVIAGQWHIQRLLHDLSLLMAAVFAGAVLGQLLLPWIPSRSFVMKGWIVGLLLIVLMNRCLHIYGYETIGNILLFPTLASFLALNFTGSTPFTSLSGVQKEILYGIPAMGGLAIVGLVIKIIFV